MRPPCFFASFSGFTRCRPFLTAALAVVLAAASPASARPIRIGAPIVSAPWSAADLLKHSVEHLRWKIPEHDFELVWTPVDDLETQLNTGRLDLAVLPSAPLNPAGIGVGRVIASVRSAAAPDPEAGSACVIVARTPTAPSDYRTLRFGADSALSVPGYLACARELLGRGANLTDLEKHTRFFGDRETRRILRALRKGDIDIAFVRAGWAEDVFLASGRHPLDDFSVLFPRTDRLAVKHSTAPYPAPTLVSGLQTPPDDLRRILTTLLTMPPDRLGAQWTIPAGSDAVNRLTRDLRIGPYDYLRHWTLQRVWQEYRPWIVVAALLLLALLLHSWVLEKLVRRRTAALTQALADQQKAERLALEKTEELKRIEQKTALSQLSSVFAHEVSGPISTLMNLTHSARLAIDNTLEKDAPPTADDWEAADERLAVIERQIGKVGDIVSRVRNYARGTAAAGEFSLADVASEACRSVKRLTGFEASLTVENDARLTGDALEAELVFVNLIKNAAEAASASPRPKVTVKIYADDATAAADVTDNGPALSEAAWQNLHARNRRSTKAEGLGLGLSLTATLIEKMDGTLQFIRRPEGGITAHVEFPKAS